MTKVSAVAKVRFIQKGETGKPGPMLYPAGAWISSKEYTRTESTAPYVLYDTGNPDTDVYYYLNKEGNFTGVDPKTDYQTNGRNATWIPFENYNAIYAKILMADFALIAGAVAYNNKMMSQKGTDGTLNYQNYDKSWEPNLLLDWHQGSLKCNNAEIRGHVEAESGSFSGYVRSLFADAGSSTCTYTYVSTAGKYFWKLNKHLNLTSVNQNLLLPNDGSYIGSNVKIFNPEFVATRTPQSTYIQVEGKDILTGFVNQRNAENSEDHPYEVEFMGGLLEFVGVPRNNGKCGWHCINYGPSINCTLFLKNGKVIY